MLKKRETEDAGTGGLNRETSVALKYHELTKHSYRSVRTNPHYLDWDNRPLPFKIYETLAPIPLPRDLSVPMTGLDAIAALGHGSPGRQIPDLAGLARICLLSNGVTRPRHLGGREFSFRAAACTGALYHIELYLVSGDCPGLAAGIYHYGAHDHALRQLRAGDFREVVVRATAAEPHVARAPVVVVCTDTFWRNTWKYQAREYRHTGWDNGVILANLLAAAATVGLPAEIVCGFADEEINRALSLNTQKEVAVSMVALGRDDQKVPPAPEVTPLDLPTTPLSQYEADYPLIHEIHAAASLDIDEVAAWRGGALRPAASAPSGPLFPLAAPAEDDLPRDALDVVILRRGSSRQFMQTAITFPQLSTILARSTSGVPADFSGGTAGGTLNDVYLIVNAVDGLPAGAYVYHRELQTLEQLSAGNFRERAGYLGLEQALAYDAAVNIYYLAPLGPILERFGNRGYRAALLEAGSLGGKVYLAAYAFGLGASGLTFYDDDVIRFFSPHAAGKSTIFLMLVGHPHKRPLH